jgi:uncharacterized membrane protein YgcG
MSHLRSLSATLLSAAISFCLVTASGCGTSAVGIDACRDIERARCRASEACGTVDGVAACERYVRDHCLHGLADAPPSQAVVDGCVQVIVSAGKCAEGDPEARLEDCDPFVTESEPSLILACDVVAHPERADECAFLLDVPDEGSAGQNAGGQASSGSGGSSGSTGASGGETASGGVPTE